MGAVSLAPAAAGEGAAGQERGVGPCGRLPVRSHNSSSLTRQIKDFVNYLRRLLQDHPMFFKVLLVGGVD